MTDALFRKPVLGWLGGLALGVVWIVPVSAQLPLSPLGGTARLVGQVTDDQGQPVVGAVIRLGTVQTKTDASGSYVLEQLRPAQWEVQFEAPTYQNMRTRIWLYGGLTTAQDARLSLPVLEQPQVLVGLVGVGSLPRTNQLAQRLASDLVRLKGFPEVAPLQALRQEKLDPVVRKLKRPLAEVLDRDRPEPELVGQFFRYLGLKALVVSRTDALIKPSATSNQTEVKSRTRIELWRFREDVLQIQVLAEESQEENADVRLNEDEAKAILQIHITKMATRITDRWQGDNTPLSPYLGNLQPEATPRQVNTTKVEITPR